LKERKQVVGSSVLGSMKVVLESHSDVPAAEVVRIVVAPDVLLLLGPLLFFSPVPSSRKYLTLFQR
jgi:hypothetical protein